jgi:hypothetical protein
MDIYIHKDTLGFQQHLVVGDNGSVRKIKEIPEDQFLVFGDPEFTEIAKVYGLPVPKFPSTPHTKALEGILGAANTSGVPWMLTMPPKTFKGAVERLAEELWASFSKIDLGYYLNHYRKTLPLLEKMEQAKIDPRAWMFHKSNPELATPHVFQSFEPNEHWFAQKVHYSKSETKTGRLKVVQGPNVLLLPKVQRNILASRFGTNGKVMQLDFRALEPRVVLFVNQLSSLPLSGNVPLLGYRAIEEDIYQDVLHTLGITDIHRDKVKDVILSQLYGAGYDKILASLDSIRDPEGFMEAVNDYFGLGAIRERLVQEYEANNREFILNYYGRRLNTTDAKPYMLLNYFTQSTAVDVALYGFRNIIRAVSGNSLIIPLFILHDALVLDVHNSAMDQLDHLRAVGSRDIPKFSGCEFSI